MVVQQRISKLIKELARRRRALGMPYDTLAARSGVSVPTLKRILTSPDQDPTISTVVATAAAMGLEVNFQPVATALEMQQQQAGKKAREGVDRVQATSGLETQALSEAELNDMVEQATHDWMAGSRRKLWAS